jgi:hypothetical protein
VSEDPDRHGVSEAQRRRAERERLVVEYLATGATYAAAAATAGIGRRSLHPSGRMGGLSARVRGRRRSGRPGLELGFG